MLITTFLSCKKKDNSDNLNNKSIWKSYKAASLFGLNAVTVDKDGNIWLGSQQNGVIKYSNNVWTNFNKDNGLPGNNITCIGLDKSGSKWFGTVNGLSKFDEIKWETFLNKDNETGYSVSGIVID